jgi:type III restriction enzyme
MQTQSTHTTDTELKNFYAEPDYWDLVNSQQSVYNLVTNNQKKEQFLISPIIFFNHYCVGGVIETARSLRHLLETEAIKGTIPVRPIVLFIVPPDWKENELQKLKQQLLQQGISSEEIKLKTNSINELNGIDLLSPSCKVRYIISTTGNWHCPFIYILVSLTPLLTLYNIQLPQPSCYTTLPLLNAVYILTASSKFETIIAPFYKHVSASGLHNREIRIKDARIELLKRASVFEVLGEKNTMDPSIIECIRKMTETPPPGENPL